MTQLANPNAELALLGALLRASPEQRLQIVIQGREDWFTAAERVCAWRVMQEMVNKALPVDMTLLDDGLRPFLPERSRAELVQQMGGMLPSAAAWAVLAERVQSYYVRRRGIAAIDAARAQFMDLKVSATDALEAAESALFDLHEKKEGVGMRHVSASLKQAYASIEESISNRGYVTGGLPFGFTDFDRCYIKGMRPGHVIMYVAPPGGGKTVAMMKTAWNRAFGRGDYDEYDRALAFAEKGEKHLNYLPCETGVFTLEMDDVSLTERLLITQSKVEIAKMHRGTMSRWDQEQLRKANQRIIDSKLYFEFVPGISIQELRVKARYAVMRFKLKLLCIDYAQLITSSSKSSQGNRTQEMVDVSKGLKLLAQECGVPVIVLAQPKQETWGHRAGLNAMAETAQLAKDADLVVMFGFWNSIKKQLEGLEKATKQAVMGEEADEEFEDREADDPTVYAYADIVKNRHGPNTNGKPPIKLRWDRDFFDFVSTNCRLLDGTGKETQAS
ncbi:replicative DNA helicase [Prosthecobacter sp.]|uniref:replicative DNA helicase n=1 Tax=Prosthecobacter sp. TaxID=1965333 RepID=UPI0037840379